MLSLTRLVVNTTDVEALVALPESCVVLVCCLAVYYEVINNAPLPLTVIDVTSARFSTGVAVPATDVASTPATAAMEADFMVMVDV